MDMEKIGRLAFIVGLVISVIAGLFDLSTMGIEIYVFAVLAVLGVIVGFLNVKGEEVQQFLVATIALVLVGTALISIPAIGTIATSIVSAFISFVSGAALIVALKTVYSVSKAPAV